MSYYSNLRESVEDGKSRFYVSVTGMREFTDYDTFKKVLESAIRVKVTTHKIIFITGNRPGIDRMVVRYVKENLHTEIFKVPLYKTEKGKMKCEFKRNQEIVNAANATIVFTDHSVRVVNDLLFRAINAGKPSIMYDIIKGKSIFYNLRKQE